MRDCIKQPDILTPPGNETGVTHGQPCSTVGPTLDTARLADTIRITLNGRHAMTRPQLAAALDLDPAAGDTTVRHALRRAGIDPDGHLDGRTPLYYATPTLRTLRARPGRWPRSGASVSEPPKTS